MLEFMLLATFTCVNIQLKQSKICIKQIQKLTFSKFQLIYGISVFNICVLLAGRILQIVIVTESFL